MEVRSTAAQGQPKETLNDWMNKELYVDNTASRLEDDGLVSSKQPAYFHGSKKGI